MSRKLLVATHNRGKVKELAELLSDIELTLLSLDDVDISWEVEESGETFRDNAVLKATTYARAADLLTLADDSGLEVDALGGLPGVHTARFGGEGLNSVERYQLLLHELEGVPPEARGARFRCVVALAGPDRLLATSEGSVAGRIAMAPSGNGGFGYDPVFFVVEAGKTMAELPAGVKNRISHRARAVATMKRQLKDVLEGRT
jgi:XTP/dITP diphosphohydrolase